MEFNDHWPTESSVHVVSATCFLVLSILSGKQNFSAFVKFKLSDFTVRWVNWALDTRTAFLIYHYLFDVDAPFSSVNSEDFAVLSLTTILWASSDNFNCVSFSYTSWSGIVLGSEFFTQFAAHHLSSNTARSCKVSLSRLSSLARNTYIILGQNKEVIIYLLVCVFIL